MKTNGPDISAVKQAISDMIELLQTKEWRAAQVKEKKEKKVKFTKKKKNKLFKFCIKFKSYFKKRIY